MQHICETYMATNDRL